MKIALSILLCLTVVLITNAQVARKTTIKKQKAKNAGLQIEPISDPFSFIKNNITGKCVTIDNFKFNGSGQTKDTTNGYSAIGVFTDTTGTIGIPEGLLITTGLASNAIGPNNSASTSQVNGLPGDATLDSICSANTLDATSFEFDFTPQADTIFAFTFVFASEEYPEYVNAGFNDVFGVFISGPGINGYQNIALIPGTTVPIAIDNINTGSYPQYYHDNANGLYLEYDGFTSPFTATFPVIPGETYHIKMAVADVGDEAFDSGVFIAFNSFMGNQEQTTSYFSYNVNGNTVSFQNLSTEGINYLWDFGDGTTSTEENPTHTYTTKSNYTATLTASNYCFNQTFSQQINLNTNNVEINPNRKVTVKSENGLVKIYNAGKTNVTIYDITGKPVKNQMLNSNGIIDISSLPAGLYFCKINQATYKIIR